MLYGFSLGRSLASFASNSSCSSDFLATTTLTCAGVMKSEGLMAADVLKTSAQTPCLEVWHELVHCVQISSCPAY